MESAIKELWKLGKLDWKLTSIQKKMKKEILESPESISVTLASRRIGRTYLLCVLAVETCLAKPDSVVKFLVPKNRSIKSLIFPTMKTICVDAGDFKPDFIKEDNAIRFTNGSEIHLSGSDNGAAEDLRGGDCDLVIIDSASFCQDLTYTVRSIFRPQTIVKKSKIIISDCLPRERKNEFLTDWVLPRALECKLKRYDIYQSGLSKEEIEQIRADMDPKDFAQEFELKYV